MQDIIDRLIAFDRFSMKLLYDSVWEIFSTDAEIIDSLNTLKDDFGTNKYKKIAAGILRHSFLIELVKLPKVETTKFRTRWDSQLHKDRRECCFIEGLEIAKNLVLSLVDIAEIETSFYFGMVKFNYTTRTLSV